MLIEISLQLEVIDLLPINSANIYSSYNDGYVSNIPRTQILDIIHNVLKLTITAQLYCACVVK